MPGRELLPAGLSRLQIEEALLGGVAYLLCARLGEPQRLADDYSEALHFLLLPYLSDGETDRVVAAERWRAPSP